MRQSEVVGWIIITDSVITRTTIRRDNLSVRIRMNVYEHAIGGERERASLSNPKSPNIFVLYV